MIYVTRKFPVGKTILFKLSTDGELNWIPSKGQMPLGVFDGPVLLFAAVIGH